MEEQVILVKDKEFWAKLTTEEAEDFNLVVQTEKTYERYKNELLSSFEFANVELLQDIQQNGYAFSLDVDKLNKKFDKPSLILFINKIDYAALLRR